MTETSIDWADPGPSRRNRIDHDRIAAELRKRPGEWAKVGVGFQKMAQEIKRGKLAAYRPAGSFEATTRNRRMPGDGKKWPIADIYARYIEKEAKQ